MNYMPDNIKACTEFDIETGCRVLKANAPEDIRQKAIEWEKEFYRKTARRCIININID